MTTTVSGPKPVESYTPAEADVHARRQMDRSLASGIAWTAGMRGLTQAFQWVAALVVVRLLSPSDYGLVAMATAYVGLVRMLSEFGLGAAIVQRQGLSEEQVARLNAVSIAFSVGFALLSIALAGLIASFFNEPDVQLLVVVLSATFIFGGIEVVPRSLLKRDLSFKRLAGIQAAENLGYTITTLSLAAFGYGYWALVIGSIVGSFARMVVALRLRGHAVRWPGQFETIRSELLFGWHVMSARFALYVRQFADIAIVGRVLGKASLGAYNVAWTQANIPVDRVTAVISEVTPSIFAASQHDLPALRRYVRIITEGIAFISFPATVGMALVADRFVLVVFGEQWAATIPALRILALVGALRSITPILSQILIATERAKKNMNFTLASAIIIPILLLIGTRWGLAGVAAAWLIGHPIVMLPVLLPEALRAIEMPARTYFAALRPPAVACAVMAAVILGVRFAAPSDWSLTAHFAVEVAAGALTYGAGIFWAYRTRLNTFIALLRSAKGGTSVPVAQ